MAGGPGQMSKRTLGLLLIFLTAIIWVVTSFISESLVSATNTGDAPKVPAFLLTWLATSLFTLYLPFIYVRSWWSHRKGADARPYAAVAVGETTDVEGPPARSPRNRDATALHSPTAGTSPKHQAHPGPAAKGPASVFANQKAIHAALWSTPLWFLAQYSFNASLARTSVTSNTILSSTSSLFTFALSVMLLGERFTMRKLACILACMLGTVLVTFSDVEAHDTQPPGPPPLLLAAAPRSLLAAGATGASRHTQQSTANDDTMQHSIPSSIGAYYSGAYHPDTQRGAALLLRSVQPDSQPHQPQSDDRPHRLLTLQRMSVTGWVRYTVSQLLSWVGTMTSSQDRASLAYTHSNYGQQATHTVPHRVTPGSVDSVGQIAHSSARRGLLGSDSRVEVGSGGRMSDTGSLSAPVAKAPQPSGVMLTHESVYDSVHEAESEHDSMLAQHAAQQSAHQSMATGTQGVHGPHGHDSSTGSGSSKKKGWRDDIQHDSAPLLGDLLVLASAALYGGYTVVMRLKLPGEDAEEQVAPFFGFVGLFSTVGLAPLIMVLLASGVFNLSKIPRDAYGIILLEGLLDYVLSDYLWARAVMLVGPTVATLSLSVQIPLAVVLELLSGSPPSWTHHTHTILVTLLGTLFILAGFVGINIEGSKEDSNSIPNDDDSNHGIAGGAQHQGSLQDGSISGSGVDASVQRAVAWARVRLRAVFMSVGRSLGVAGRAGREVKYSDTGDSEWLVPRTEGAQRQTFDLPAAER